MFTNALRSRIVKPDICSVTFWDRSLLPFFILHFKWQDICLLVQPYETCFQVQNSFSNFAIACQFVNHFINLIIHVI